MENFLKSKVLQKKSLEMFLKTMRIINAIKLDDEQDLNLPFKFQYVFPIFLVDRETDVELFPFHFSLFRESNLRGSNRKRTSR